MKRKCGPILGLLFKHEREADLTTHRFVLYHCHSDACEGAGRKPALRHTAHQNQNNNSSFPDKYKNSLRGLSLTSLQKPVIGWQVSLTKITPPAHAQTGRTMLACVHSHENLPSDEHMQELQLGPLRCTRLHSRKNYRHLHPNNQPNTLQTLGNPPPATAAAGATARASVAQ